MEQKTQNDQICIAISGRFSGEMVTIQRSVQQQNPHVTLLDIPF